MGFLFVSELSFLHYFQQFYSYIALTVMKYLAGNFGSWLDLETERRLTHEIFLISYFGLTLFFATIFCLKFQCHLVTAAVAPALLALTVSSLVCPHTPLFAAVVPEKLVRSKKTKIKASLRRLHKKNPEKVWSFAKPPPGPPPQFGIFSTTKNYPHFFC